MEAVTAPPRTRIINIEGLGLAFEQDGRRTQVLQGLDLEICAGEFIAIVGASGVGKSTLLRVLMDLAKPTEGVVTITPDPNAERPMAMVFQDARLLPWRRVLSNVMFGLEKTSLTKAQRVTRATEVLALVGLSDMAARWPYQLSGGQRQRVALARALAVRPSILLMDEPFSALDVATRENLQDELIRIRAETGRTILFVTHDIDEAVYMADKVVALGGKPGVVRSNRKIDVPRPRRRGSIALAEIAQDVRNDLAADHRDPDFVI